MEDIDPRHPKFKIETYHQMVRAKHVEAPLVETTVYIKYVLMYRQDLIAIVILLVGEAIQLVETIQLDGATQLTITIQLAGGIKLIESFLALDLGTSASYLARYLSQLFS